MAWWSCGGCALCRSTGSAEVACGKSVREEHASCAPVVTSTRACRAARPPFISQHDLFESVLRGARGPRQLRPDDYASGWQAARLVDKILKGTAPREIPAEVSTRLKFLINLKTATALGLTIAPQVLFQADEVRREPVRVLRRRLWKGSPRTPCPPGKHDMLWPGRQSPASVARAEDIPRLPAAVPPPRSTGVSHACASSRSRFPRMVTATPGRRHTDVTRQVGRASRCLVSAHKGSDGA